MLNESTSIKGESSTPFAGAKKYLKKMATKATAKKAAPAAKKTAAASKAKPKAKK